MAGPALPVENLGAGETYDRFTKVVNGGLVFNATAVSSAASLNAESPLALVANLGTAHAFVEMLIGTGGSAVQGTSIPVVANGGTIVLNTASCDHVAAVTSSGSTVLSIIQGFGHP